MSGKKRILLVVLLITVAAAIYVYREYNRTNVNIATEKSAFTVSAPELIIAFSGDNSVASKKYVGKIISVTGMVKNVYRDDRGYYTLSLGDTSSVSSVRCSVDSMYTNRAASIKAGMNVVVKGNCTGYNEDELLGLDVIVNRCVIEEH
ncbi:MAG TPA: hypothetical protein VKA49_02585 [Flavitalea sp.]|nr:hypothetical protein [Flavitalea sp.]